MVRTLQQVCWFLEQTAQTTTQTNRNARATIWESSIGSAWVWRKTVHTTSRLPLKICGSRWTERHAQSYHIRDSENSVQQAKYQNGYFEQYSKYPQQLLLMCYLHQKLMTPSKLSVCWTGPRISKSSTMTAREQVTLWLNLSLERRLECNPILATTNGALEL